MYKLPITYTPLSSYHRRKVREQYVTQQEGKCWYCQSLLSEDPIEAILDYPVNLALFPPGFLNHPVHLQHDHVSDLTEGAVHARCNAVLWQHFGR